MATASNVARRHAADEQELARKREELGALEWTLVERELALQTLGAELQTFEARYRSLLATKYAELDELEAQIAELQALRNRDDDAAQQRAGSARAQASQSAREAREQPRPGTDRPFRPSEDLKSLWRRLAKRIHPDGAMDEADREYRARLMAEVNEAYQAQDYDRLEGILREWEERPQAVQGESTEAELERVTRRIAQVQRRLEEIEARLNELRRSDLFQLKSSAELGGSAGEDLLTQLAADIDSQIAAAKDRLRTLAAEDSAESTASA